MKKNHAVCVALVAVFGGCETQSPHPGFFGGLAAPAPAGAVVIDPDGVVGRVLDTADGVVRGGTVFFVPADDVAALPITTTAVGSQDDEPLEDLIALRGDTYPQATIDADGIYGVDTLPAGSYFVTFVPEPGEQTLLPGGSRCREALGTEALVGKRLDLKVSTAPPPGAEFIGSYWCVACHSSADHSARHASHRLGIWSPYEIGDLQAEPTGEQWEAFSDKFTATGTTIYYYGMDGSRGFDKYRTSETSSGDDSFTVTTFSDQTGFKIRLHNVKNPSDPDRVLRVDAAYGGRVYKQRFLTRVTNDHGFFLAILPMQYQHSGDEDTIYGRSSKVWRDYHGSRWYDEEAMLFKDPAVAKSFEKNCASCHSATARLTGSDDTTWTLEFRKLEPAADMDVGGEPGVTLGDQRRWGDFDYDGDGHLDEMNFGCETCHGPGSDHWAAAGACNMCHGDALPTTGKPTKAGYIVSPQLLTPERAGMICGQCHSRPKGWLGTDNPVNEAGEMMLAGTSRDVFLAEYASTQLDGAGSNFYGDERRHSSSHHQQYSDHIMSRHYKNATRLVTCSDCHDPHGSDYKNDLRFEPDDNEAGCNAKGCHVPEETAVSHEATLCPETDTASCLLCHMPKTAKSGAGEPGLSIDGLQYWQKDISSHIFDAPNKSSSAVTLADGTPGFNMPTGYTNSCAGTCHVIMP